MSYIVIIITKQIVIITIERSIKMTDEQMLLAISNMMDAKLKPVHNEIQAVKTGLQTEIQAVKADLQAEIQAVKTDLQAEIQAVKTDLQAVKADLQAVKADLQAVKISQENVILPRLEEIESCYTDTYKRYQNGIDKIDAMEIDINNLKKVTLQHSEAIAKLQKMA